jgi:hypothetical protein
MKSFALAGDRFAFSAATYRDWLPFISRSVNLQLLQAGFAVPGFVSHYSCSDYHYSLRAGTGTSLDAEQRLS